MKLHDERREVSSQGTGRTKAFTIKASAKAFERLAADYSDSILAVVRELSTNAADSMADAGKANEPFFIHLPNEFEPWFSVRDNGTGMDEDTVWNLYTTFFDSDKTDTDEQTGCLGLGSKSPFAYTDSFTVISRYNGQQTNYTCFTHEDGCPHVTAHDPIDTEECNGVEILLGVDKKDFDEFKEKAQEALQWFSSPYEVVGNARFKVEPIEYLYKTDTYGILKQRHGYSTVVMGNVGYRLDRYGSYNTNVDSHIRLIEHGVHLFVPMGSVDFQNNREQMRVTDKTRNTLNDSLNEIVAYVRDDAVKEVAKATTKWEAMSIYNGNSHPIMGSIRNHGWKAYWEDEEIQGVFNFNKMDDAPLLEVINLGYRNQSVGYEKSRETYLAAPAPGDEFHLFICDLNTGNYKRVVDHLQSKHSNFWNGNHRAYLISPKYKQLLSKNFHGKKEPFGENDSPMDIIEFLKEAGIPYKLTSSLEDNKVASTRTYTKRTELAKLNEWKYSGSSNSWEYWTPADVDVSQGGFYIEIAHYNCFYPPKENDRSQKESPSFLQKIVRIMRNFLPEGTEAPKIYGIRPCDAKVLKKHQDKWVNVYDHMQKLWEENVEEWGSLVILRHNFLHESNNRWLYHALKAPGFEYDHEIASKYAVLAQRLSEHENDPRLSDFSCLDSQFNKKVDYTQFGVHGMENTILSDFPLLGHFNHYYYNRSEDKKLSANTREYIIALKGGKHASASDGGKS